MKALQPRQATGEHPVVRMAVSVELAGSTSSIVSHGSRRYAPTERIKRIAGTAASEVLGQRDGACTRLPTRVLWQENTNCGKSGGRDGGASRQTARVGGAWVRTVVRSRCAVKSSKTRAWPDTLACHALREAQKEKKKKKSPN